MMLNFFEKIISFLEKERFNLIGIFVFIFCISFIRMWAEDHLFNYHYSIINYAHTVSFYFPVFAGGIFILKVFTKEKIMRILNLVSLGFIILPLAPIVDFFIFNRTIGYDYLPRGIFIDILIVGKPPFQFAGIAQTLMLYCIVALTTLYVFIKTKSYSKSIINFFVFYCFMIIISIPSINPLFMIPPSQSVFFVYYIILTGIIISFIIKISKKGLLTSFLYSLRLPTTFHAIAMVLLGIFVADKIEIGHIFTYPLSERFGMLMISILIIVFIWWFTVLLNQVYDIGIDEITNKKRILVYYKEYSSQLKQVAILFGILSFLLSCLLGYIVILTSIALFLGILYSVPPFRLRTSIFSPVFIGLGSSIGFFIGYLTPKPFTYLSNVPNFSFQSLKIGFVIFFALTIGPCIKDFKDYAGDSKHGVKNIFTLYGLKKGINITSLFLFISFICPLLLFNTIMDFVSLLPLGLAASFIFKSFRNVNIVFGMYFIVFVYCLGRFLALL